MNTVIVHVWKYHLLFIRSPITRYLGCFRLLAVVSNAPVNTGAYLSLRLSAFDSFGYVPRVDQTVIAFLIF